MTVGMCARKQGALALQGQLSRIQDNVKAKSVDERFNNMGVSSGYVFISQSRQDRPCALSGDSGAMVFPDTRNFIGLLWRRPSSDVN